MIKINVQEGDEQDEQNLEYRENFFSRFFSQKEDQLGLNKKRQESTMDEQASSVENPEQIEKASEQDEQNSEIQENPSLKLDKPNLMDVQESSVENPEQIERASEQDEQNSEIQENPSLKFDKPNLMDVQASSENHKQNQNASEQKKFHRQNLTRQTFGAVFQQLYLHFKLEKPQQGENPLTYPIQRLYMFKYKEGSNLQSYPIKILVMFNYKGNIKQQQIKNKCEKIVESQIRIIQEDKRIGQTQSQKKKQKLNNCKQIIRVYFEKNWRQALKTAYDGYQGDYYVEAMREIQQLEKMLTKNRGLPIEDSQDSDSDY